MAKEKFNVKTRTQSKSLVVDELCGQSWKSVRKTRKVMKHVQQLVPDELSDKLAAQKVIERKDEAGTEVSEEERDAVKFSDEEQDQLLDITYEQIALLLEDEAGAHPGVEALGEELDFEIATDMVKALLPGPEADASPPVASKAG